MCVCIIFFCSIEFQLNFVGQKKRKHMEKNRLERETEKKRDREKAGEREERNKKIVDFFFFVIDLLGCLALIFKLFHLSLN